MAIQAIEKDHTQGWQVRIFRNGRVARTKFLAYRKYGGKDTAYLLAQGVEIALNDEVTRQVGPEVRAHNEKGQHHQNPASNNRSQLPGISIDYHAGNRRKPVLTVHVRWMEGEPPRRRQRHTSFGVEAHGLLPALQLALDKRFEKTGIVQPTARAAWKKLKDSVPPHPVTGKKTPAALPGGLRLFSAE